MIGAFFCCASEPLYLLTPQGCVNVCGTGELGWSDAQQSTNLSGDGTTCTSSFLFTEGAADHTVTLGSNTDGTVSASGDSWDPVTKTAEYVHGGTATVTDTPDPGYEFLYWADEIPLRVI